jgi:hypothetical protein
MQGVVWEGEGCEVFPYPDFPPVETTDIVVKNDSQTFRLCVALKDFSNQTFGHLVEKGVANGEAKKLMTS